MSIPFLLHASCKRHSCNAQRIEDMTTLKNKFKRSQITTPALLREVRVFMHADMAS